MSGLKRLELGEEVQSLIMLHIAMLRSSEFYKEV